MNVIEKGVVIASLLQQSGADVINSSDMINVLREVTGGNIAFINAAGEISNSTTEQFNLNLSESSIIENIMEGNKKIGSVVVAKEIAPTDEDIVFTKIIAALIGKSMARTKVEAAEEEDRNKMAARNALKSLSFTEICAVQSIFDELKGTEGLLVASKIADRVGFTRSVIVNAVRKLEGANVVESRSLGMKGTHIRILNNYLLPELANIKQ